MSAKNITILTPNGHRPVVKVSSHTTILEALEEACKKQNFDPEKYDLKQGNKVLDVNTTFGYANIPNNARLEMVLCKTPRVVSNVTVNIVMESGEKFVKEFLPTTNIETILADLGITYEPETAFLIYLQRRILGKDFKSTTLRSLGLTQGKHLFRFKTETTKEQAHVYVPAKPKVSEINESSDNNDVSRPSSAPKVEPKTEKPKVVEQNKPSLAQKKPMDPISILKAEKLNAKKSKNEAEETDLTSVGKQKTEPMEVCDAEVKTEQNGIVEKIPDDVKMEEESFQVHILGERDALVYNRAHVKAAVQLETPDSFFEPTKSDVIAILEDRKKALDSMNNAPLLTAAQKLAIKQKEIETKLKKFEKTIIRINFPNQLVLQGVFSPVDTVEVVKKFVKTYLKDPKSDFTLYIIPPRTDLDPKGRLIDLDLVPSSNVYYSGSSELKSEIQTKLTDPTSADLQANKTRLKTTHDVSPQDDNPIIKTAPTAHDPAQPGPSRTSDESAQQPAGPQRPPHQSQPSDAKVPKWFKRFGK